MKKGTSLYLDLVRFSAAFMVFFEHLHAHTKVSFSHFWGLYPYWSARLIFYSQTAVMVFFVLSGYVIAHVLETREKTPREFAASRLARLYSVVLPALLLTAGTNYLEALRHPEAFHALGGFDAVLRYLGTAAFVGQYWLWPELDPPNTPFWTLSVEATFYLGIALFIFTSGRLRVLNLIGLSVAAGPTIILLAPTWLLGFGAYHASRRLQPRAAIAVVLWFGSLVLLCLCPLIEEHVRTRLPFLRMPDPSLGELLASYGTAICFATNVLMFNGFADGAEVLLLPWARLIRWLGSMTFALYLFHQPLMSFFTVYGFSDRSSANQMILLAGGTFLIVATLGRFCEQSKDAYKSCFLSLWRQAATHMAARAAATSER